MSVAAFLAAFGGFAVLAAAMSRHYQAVTGRGLSARAALVLRGAGSALLAASLLLSLAWLGSPVGFVAWFGLLNAAALATALGLTLAKGRRRR